VSFVHELRVRYGECDPQGIVFNANYLLYFDVAFTEFWRDRIGPWDDMALLGVDAVVAEANLRFRVPARLDDVLALEVTTEELGTTSMSTRIDVERDGELLVEMRLRHVFVDRDTWSKTAMPEEIREKLAAPAP
jgi:acyl-CoA thioester hydrolase